MPTDTTHEKHTREELVWLFKCNIVEYFPFSPFAALRLQSLQGSVSVPSLKWSVAVMHLHKTGSGIRQMHIIIYSPLPLLKPIPFQHAPDGANTHSLLLLWLLLLTTITTTTITIATTVNKYTLTVPYSYSSLPKIDILLLSFLCSRYPDPKKKKSSTLSTTSLITNLNWMTIVLECWSLCSGSGWSSGLNVCALRCELVIQTPASAWKKRHVWWWWCGTKRVNEFKCGDWCVCTCT